MTESRAPMPHESLRAAAAGVLAFATSEWVIVLASARARSSPSVVVSLLCLDLTLSALLLVVLAPLAWGLGRLLPRREVREDDSVSRHVAGLAACGFVVWALLRLAVRLHPPLDPHVPWRHLLAAFSFGLGVLTRRHWFRYPPGAPRLALSLFALGVPLTLGTTGHDSAAKSLAVGHSPPLASLVALVRKANDFDGDGYGSLLGENDCAAFDAHIHPLARDLPDNGVDENCDGRDFRLEDALRESAGKQLPVPEPFRGEPNLLLVTIDSLRYDHTSLGGWAARRGRDTTPNLARLAARSASFAFANAPSAGTMASVPSILTSKFFHSGLALDEKVTPGMPPRLRQENVLVAEILKRKGYVTGAILGHVYFNDFGLEQGFDTYDNELGRTHDPSAVTSDRLTDKALDWIARRRGQKWFLWLHYLVPHAHYVAHPGFPSFGSSEEDLYDGEVAFTDHHLGRLVDALPERTAIVVTADHGDGFREHGFTNHGQALYFELLHVPLVVHSPGIEPRVIEGPVSGMDIVPTLAALAEADVSGLSFEGESLVPQLYYRRDARDRSVYAETNWPSVLRAVITTERKLVYRLEDNLYELYDLKADPREQRNLWPAERGPSFEPLRRRLDDWLERVYYAREPASNQVMQKLDGVLLREAPRPAHPLRDVRLDAGRVEVLGFDLEPARPRPGDALEISVYLHVRARAERDWRLVLEGRTKAGPVSSPPADRLLPPARWREGEFVRAVFELAPGTLDWSLKKVGGGVADEVVRLGALPR